MLVTSRDTDNFFKISLEETNKIAFNYRLGDRDFKVEMTAPVKKTFCDVQRHRIEFKRYGKLINYSADGGEEMQKEDNDVKASFSKPDKIVLGGISTSKFDGCIYNAFVLFHWKTVLSSIKNIGVNIVELYLEKNPSVHSAAVFVGACPDTESSGGYQLQGEFMTSYSRHSGRAKQHCEQDRHGCHSP